MKDDSDYLGKIRRFKKSIDKIVRDNNHNTIFYTFAVIPAFFLMLKKVKYVYELSDLLYGYPRFNMVRPICKFIEQLIIKRSELTLMTSTGFCNYLFPKSKPKNVIIQPNKLNSYFKNQIRPTIKPIIENHIRFAFVGAIRYKETILRFAKIVGKYFPQHEFHFWGDSVFVDDFQNETKCYSNVYFHGPFRNPYDLSTIYTEIDIILAAYETGSLNERIAEPNKLYESVYFCKPIIVSQNSFLEKQVIKLKCGYVLNAYSDKEIVDFINGLDEPSLREIQITESKINTNMLIDNPGNFIEILKKV